MVWDPINVACCFHLHTYSEWGRQTRYTLSFSPIHTSLNKFVANCKNLTGVLGEDSDKLVSTPGAPNIRIVPFNVPVLLNTVYWPELSDHIHLWQVYWRQDRMQKWRRLRDGRGFWVFRPPSLVYLANLSKDPWDCGLWSWTSCKLTNYFSTGDCGNSRGCVVTGNFGVIRGKVARDHTSNEVLHEFIK